MGLSKQDKEHPKVRKRTKPQRGKKIPNTTIRLKGSERP
jgi:hypothetical protein